MWLLAGAVVLVLVALAGRYGYHRDELYFLACGRDLAWGYVDQPPVTPALARVTEVLFGNSLHGLRLVPALATGGVVLLTASTARALGASRRGEMLAAVLTVAATFFLGAGHLFSTTTFDVLFWTAILSVVVRALQPGADARLWALAGALAGVGLLNKHSVVFLVAALFGAVVIVRRDVLRSPWPWIGAAIALAIWAPNLVWHAQHDWPVIEMSESLREEGIDDGNTFLFLPAQLVLFNPVGAVAWIAGLVWLLRTDDGVARATRPVAVVYLVLAAVFVVTAGKPYYLAGLYPALFAAGAVRIERHWSAARRRHYVAALAVVGAASLVVALPLLPIDVVGDGPIAEVNPEHRESYGWTELARAVDGVGAPGDVVFTRNYGEAGAVERFSTLERPVHSGHNHYWLWGPPADDDDPATGVVLVGFFDDAYVARHFTGCELVAANHNAERVPNEEEGAPIHRCDGPRGSWTAQWDALRHYTA